MTINRLISIFSILLIFTALIVFAAIAGSFIYGPGYLESKIIPDLMNKTGLSLSSIRVRNIGISGAELSDIGLGDGILPGIGIDSMLIDYSPTGLFHGKIKKVVLSGISVPVEYMDGNISIEGLDLDRMGGGDSSGGLSIESVEIRHSLLSLSWEDNKIDIPFDMDIAFLEEDLKPDRILLKASPRGQVLRIAGAVNHDKGTMSLSILSEALLLDAFSDLIHDFVGLRPGGMIDLNISTEASLNPMGISNIDAALKLKGCGIIYQGLHLADNYYDKGEESPVTIRLKSEDLESWEFAVSRFMVFSPEIPVLTSANGEVKIEEKGIRAEGVIQTSLPEKGSGKDSVPSLKGITITTAPSLRWKVSAVMERNGTWQAQADVTSSEEKNSPAGSFFLKGMTLSSGAPEIHVKAKTEGERLSASYVINIPAIEIQNSTGLIAIPSVDVRGNFNGLYKDPGTGKASFYLKASEVEMTADGFSVRAPAVGINGNLTGDEKGNVGIIGDLAFSGAGITVQEQGITLASISGNIPFQWPSNANGKSGDINVESIGLKDMELGGMDIKVRQGKNDFVFDGKYISRIFPDLIMSLSGTAGISGEDRKALISISLPDYRLTPDIDLSVIDPRIEDVSFQGLISLSSDISLSGKEPEGKLNIGLKDSQIKAAGGDLVLEDVSGELNFLDVFSLRSAPKQTLKVGMISFNDLKADNLSADFQIESAGSIFIEQCRFEWCQGHVSVQPFRFSPGVDDYRLTLNCDRLNLADIMEQFGVAMATGSGAVNGAIPIILSKGQFTFEDGFLYSTPGVGGNIHVTGTEALTEGLPQDSDQYMQMEIAREALKDFEYEWAKMTLNTEGDDMLMKLQFDGRPADPLPFVYRKDIGKFIKLETDGQGSVFEGISLDINFRLPLNEILTYKGILF